jgi:F0F1-type ATP synthase assembly protein I
MSRLGARVVGAAIVQYLDNLSRGDPWAIGLTILIVVLGLVVAAVAIADRRSRSAEKLKAGGRR